MQNSHYFIAEGNKERNKTIRGVILMKEEYDFSKGERGKFFHPDTELCLPVYLEPDIADFMRKLAGQKDTDIEKLVNDWLRRNIGLIETLRQ